MPGEDAPTFTVPNYDRIAVWYETQAAFIADPDPSPSYALNALPAGGLAALPRRYTGTEVQFFKEDCVEVAVRHVSAGDSPLLHNMSDWTVAGGSVETGSAAQEEELFRRSNYYRHLLQSFYPLEELDTVVSPAVMFIRRGVADGYVSMDAPASIDCVAAPAVRFPQLDRATGGYASPSDEALMEQKIRMLVYAAVENKNDVLVASAWGCGAYGCPAEATGRIFRKVLEEARGLVKVVSFSILGGNFAPFQAGFLEAGAW